MSFERERRPYKPALSWIELIVNWWMECLGRTLRFLRSLRVRAIQLIILVWHLTGSAPPRNGVPPDAWGGKADISLVLPRWRAMRDQEPAPSGPCSGRAYWTQTYSVLPWASPVSSWIPGPAKRRLGLRKLGKDSGRRVYPFPTILTRSSMHDALEKLLMENQKNTWEAWE